MLSGRDADARKLLGMQDEDVFRAMLQEGLANHLDPREAVALARHGRGRKCWRARGIRR